MGSIARFFAVAIAALAAVGILGIGQALAFITDFDELEPILAPGSWHRTITDISEPNGSGGGVIQASYDVVVNYSAGTTAVQMASLFKTACESTLPGPSTGPNGYGVVFNGGTNTEVKVSKQSGTYTFSDMGLPPGVVTRVPSTAEDAPLASPAGLASLAACLSGLAFWARRRRASAYPRSPTSEEPALHRSAAVCFGVVITAAASSRWHHVRRQDEALRGPLGVLLRDPRLSGGRSRCLSPHTPRQPPERTPTGRSPAPG